MDKYFKHDCDDCKPLGMYHTIDMTYGREKFDLYYCDQQGHPTVIARYGDEGHEYTSGLCFADVSQPIGEAKRRAIERGYINAE